MSKRSISRRSGPLQRFRGRNSSGGAGGCRGNPELHHIIHSPDRQRRAILNAANNVTVHADNLNFMLTIVQAGADATNISLGGAVAVDSINSTTLANIDDGTRSLPAITWR